MDQNQILRQHPPARRSSCISHLGSFWGLGWKSVGVVNKHQPTNQATNQPTNGACGLQIPLPITSPRKQQPLLIFTEIRFPPSKHRSKYQGNFYRSIPRSLVRDSEARQTEHGGFFRKVFFFKLNWIKKDWG